jgi:hypothetical protein
VAGCDLLCACAPVLLSGAVDMCCCRRVHVVVCAATVRMSANHRLLLVGVQERQVLFAW